MSDESALNTIPKLFQAAVARKPGEQALGYVRDGKLRWLSWAELDRQVQDAAAALLDRGLQSGDRVAHVSLNGTPWIVADLAMQMAGLVHVPMHTALSVTQIAQQKDHCGAKLIVVDTELRKKELDHACGCGSVVTHADLIASVAEVGRVMRRRVLRCNTVGTDLATILYTSGTTGEPRGVMLSHGNLASNAIATAGSIGGREDELRLCFLPLSHIYARLCDLYCWVTRGSRLVLAENRDTIFRDFKLVRPTAMNGVPYFYQKAAQKLHDAGTSKQPGALRELLGGCMRQCYSGGAGAAPEVEQLFLDQGLPMLSGYGLTEASPVVSVSTKETYRPGRVGRVLPNVEVRIAPEKGDDPRLKGQGEVLVRGPNVMQGYWNDEQATRKAIRDGWLYTGDLGELDSEGSLKIVGRKKEILVLSTGKNVSPASVEQRLAGSPWIEQVCVVGEGQKYLVALIVPQAETLRREILEQQWRVTSPQQAVIHPQVLALYRREIDRQLADAGDHEQIGKFVLLDRMFSVEQGEMTPKLSLRRKKIESNFSAVIEAKYAES